MPGCPVNGPSISNSGDLIAISRYTVIDGKSKVILRILGKEKLKSGKEIILDKDSPIGRCATVCSENTIFTTWIGLDEKQAVLQFAEVSHEGKIIRRSTLSKVDANRSSGMPRIILSGNYLWVCWVDSNRILVGRLNVGGHQ
jgi:hypothetical protein